MDTPPEDTIKVQTAIDERKVNTNILFQIAAGRVACSLFTRLLRYCKNQVSVPLNSRIKQYYSVHIFHAMARLDVPTFDDDAVQRQLEQSFSPSSRSSIAWDAIVMTIQIYGTALQLISQVSVLAGVLRGQRDGFLLAILSFSYGFFRWNSATRIHDYIRSGGKSIYVCMENVKSVISSSLGCDDDKHGFHSTARVEETD